MPADRPRASLLLSGCVGIVVHVEEVADRKDLSKAVVVVCGHRASSCL